MKTDLPTDEEFLFHLYSSMHDESWLKDIKQAYEEHFNVEALYADAVAAGICMPNEIGNFKNAIEEGLFSEQGFRGTFITGLKTIAVALTTSDRDRVSSIPVGLLPSRELNACAVVTPRGGAVIILNNGVIALLVDFCRCALALLTWNRSRPYCRDASKEAYARAIVGLARCASTGDSRYAAPHRATLRFPSLGYCDNTYIALCNLIEVFILLHEYGHVIRGHLVSGRVRPAFGGQFPDIQEYSKSELEEFEADEYAIHKLIEFSGVGRSTEAVAAGVLLKFFDICELLKFPDVTRTHPPADHRWERIKTQMHLLGLSSKFALELDGAFDLVKHYAISAKSNRDP
jgi:hypothetical protein